MRIYTQNLGLLYVDISFPGFPPYFPVTVVRPTRSSDSTTNKATGFYIHFSTIVEYGAGTLAIKTLKIGNYYFLVICYVYRIHFIFTW